MKSPAEVLAPSKQIGIWIRVSTEDQAQGDSPKHHEIRARSYAESRGWVVREVYDLAGVSGKSVADHPEAKRMMEDIRRGHIGCLVFSKLARLARNTRELLDFADFFQKHGAGLISLDEAIDTNSPIGRLFYTVIAAMAQWEREEIASRIRASVAVRAKLGKPISGRVPYGYQFTDGKVSPHPNEAPVRKLMYELFAQQKRGRTVARLLNDRGYRTRDGNQWSDTSVVRLLRDPAAKGQYRMNYTKNTGKNGWWVTKPEHEWVITPVEAIVSSELWQQCNDLLEARKTRNIRPTRKVVHPFTGYVFCGCGHKLYVPSNSPKYICFKCRTKIPIVDLDALFREELKGYFLDPKQLASYLRGSDKAVSETTKLLQALRREQHNLKQEMDSTFQLYSAGGLTADQFRQRYQPLDARRGQLETEVPRAEAELAVLKVDGFSAEHVHSEALEFYSNWPKMKTEQKREIVEMLVKRIEVSGEDITISLCYHPSSKIMTEEQHMLRR